MTSTFESVTTPGLYFAGAMMHGNDYRRSAGGFIHGFRYLVRALARHLEVDVENGEWPRTELLVRASWYFVFYF